MIPDWLWLLAIIVLMSDVVAVVVVAWDLVNHPQQMAIMNVVWPATTLYAGPLGLWAYFAVGKLSAKDRVMQAKQHGEQPPNKTKPFWQMVGVGATHCGSGCTLGDIVAEWFTFFVPLTILGQHVFGTWALDYVLAFLFGIAFQYFTIKPMRQLSVGQGLVAALKADTLSLTAWQVGMYGWMALTLFVFFSPETLPKTSPVFWFMMQIAMLAGFLTSYPVNWWLLRSGIKEKM
ncbi:MAG: DUF4396 domain-containing protein [Chloroflexota bacterium]